MGFFSSFFVKRGLSNSSTNMKNPLGYSKCLELCRYYDDYGGYKTPTRLLIGTPTDPGMELYEVFRGPKEKLFYGGYGQRMLYRGVIFARVWKDDKPATELRVVEFEDLGDGGCPCFSKKGTLECVGGDLYRTSIPFIAYKDGIKVSVVAEVNWNTGTNEFVYREIYTPLDKEDK